MATIITKQGYKQLIEAGVEDLRNRGFEVVGIGVAPDVWETLGKSSPFAGVLVTEDSESEVGNIYFLLGDIDLGE